jgi:hypothetical protein
MCAPQAGYNTNSYALLTIRDSGGSTVATQTFEYGASPTGSSTARGWPYNRQIIKYVEGIDPDTDYFATFADVAHGHLSAAAVFDMQSLTEGAATGHLPENVTAQSFIVDEYRENQAAIMQALWRSSGASVLNWTVDDGTAAVTRALDASANVVDTTVTTVSASSPGYTIDMTGKDRLSQTSGVPVKMWAYGAVAAGTGGRVDILDSGGSSLANIVDWTTTPSWRETTFNLPATEDKYDLHLSEPGGSTTFSLYAISIYEYET